MDAPTEEEKILYQARSVISMHRHAKRRSARINWVIIFIGFGASWHFGNFWYLGGAAALTVVVHLYLINSVSRFVAAKMGMPRGIQGIFVHKYRTDPEFAKRVDDFREK